MKKPDVETEGDGLGPGVDFLPDLCGRREIFGLVLLAALTAIVVTLLRAPFDTAFWIFLGAYGFYLLWIALLSAATLCILRRHLRWSLRWSLLVLYVDLLLCVLVVALGAHWLLPKGVGPGAMGLVRTLLVGAILAALALRYLVALERSRRAVRREAQARFHALEARLRPHFLFNTLNTLAALVRHDPARTERAILDLAELFRASLDRTGGTSTLGEELRLARRYLALEELRLGERLQVRWETDALPDDALVPSLLLQPLVENAIYHSLESLATGGVLEIQGRRDRRGWITILIVNTLGETSDGHRGRGVALAALAERLDLFFPGEHRFEAARESEHYVVRLSFSYRPAAQEL